MNKRFIGSFPEKKKNCDFRLSGKKFICRSNTNCRSNAHSMIFNTDYNELNPDLNSPLKVKGAYVPKQLKLKPKRSNSTLEIDYLICDLLNHKKSKVQTVQLPKFRSKERIFWRCVFSGGWHSMLNFSALIFRFFLCTNLRIDFWAQLSHNVVSTAHILTHFLFRLDFRLDYLLWFFNKYMDNNIWL